MNRLSYIVASAGILCIIIAAISAKDEINDDLELFTSYFTVLNEYYVDSVDSRKLLRTAMDAAVQKAGVKTVVLFFEKGTPTQKIWYYELDPGRSLGKTNPLNDEDLREFVEQQALFTESDKSWSVEIRDVDPETFDLSVKNPNAPEEEPLRNPEEIIAEIMALDTKTADILAGIRELV